jgi:hypothetical protein
MIKYGDSVEVHDRVETVSYCNNCAPSELSANDALHKLVCFMVDTKTKELSAWRVVGTGCQRGKGDNSLACSLVEDHNL